VESRRSRKATAANAPETSLPPGTASLRSRSRTRSVICDLRHVGKASSEHTPETLQKGALWRMKRHLLQEKRGGGDPSSMWVPGPSCIEVPRKAALRERHDLGLAEPFGQPGTAPFPAGHHTATASRGHLNLLMSGHCVLTSGNRLSRLFGTPTISNRCTSEALRAHRATATSLCVIPQRRRRQEPVAFIKATAHHRNP
jgi:hypothetical protein